MDKVLLDNTNDTQELTPLAAIAIPCEDRTIAEQQDALRTTFKQAFGTDNKPFAIKLGDLCGNACSSVGFDEETGNLFGPRALLAVLTDLKPNDAIEGMLLARMLCLHSQSMKMLGIVEANSGSPQVVETYVNMSTKLARLYNESLDALTKYRRKGTQQVIVQHVNVNDGGRAIVGNMLAEQGACENIGDFPHA